MYNDYDRYDSLDEFKKDILYKRIVEWTEDKLVLEDGKVLTLQTSEQDCCAFAYGAFSNVTLDAMITDVVLGEEVNVEDWDTIVNEVQLNIFHNQNSIAQANMTANAGNGGYYYSVGSVVVDNKHFNIVSA